MIKLSRRQILRGFTTTAFSYGIFGLPRLANAEEDPMAEFDRLERQSFSNFEDMVEQSFAELERMTQEAFRAAEKNIEKKWGKNGTVLPSAKVWVGYNNDKTSRIIVDYEHGKVTMETIIDFDAKDLQTQKLSALIDRVMTTPPEETDALDPVFSHLKPAFEKISPGIRSGPISKAKSIARLISEDPSGKQASDIMKKMVRNTSNLKTRPAMTPAGRKKKIVTATIPMRRNFNQLNAQSVSSMVSREANRFRIPRELVFAIIKNESAFNPRAISHVPAYGLMQLVPRSGGADAYKFVYKDDAIVDMNYLFMPPNNIELGTAYLHILYYKYLSGIRDSQSRTYCVIAGYNTGAGNVARAFTGKRQTKGLFKKTNGLSAEQVYSHLQHNLPYDETKKYLSRVAKSMAYYKINI